MLKQKLISSNHGFPQSCKLGSSTVREYKVEGAMYRHSPVSADRIIVLGMHKRKWPPTVL